VTVTANSRIETAVAVAYKGYKDSLTHRPVSTGATGESLDDGAGACPAIPVLYRIVPVQLHRTNPQVRRLCQTVAVQLYRLHEVD
jgi:hypothetical protein